MKKKNHNTNPQQQGLFPEIMTRLRKNKIHKLCCEELHVGTVFSFIEQYAKHHCAEERAHILTLKGTS